MRLAALALAFWPAVSLVAASESIDPALADCLHRLTPKNPILVNSRNNVALRVLPEDLMFRWLSSVHDNRWGEVALLARLPNRIDTRITVGLVRFLQTGSKVWMDRADVAPGFEDSPIGEVLIRFMIANLTNVATLKMRIMLDSSLGQPIWKALESGAPPQAAFELAPLFNLLRQCGFGQIRVADCYILPLNEGRPDPHYILQLAVAPTAQP